MLPPDYLETEWMTAVTRQPKTAGQSGRGGDGQSPQAVRARAGGKAAAGVRWAANARPLRNCYE
jgi:hypothetical protein